MQSTVLISGANSGMGLATALLLAEHGFEIYAGARTAEGRVEIAERPNDRCASHRSASMFRTPTPRCKVARNRPTAGSHSEADSNVLLLFFDPLMRPGDIRRAEDIAQARECDARWGR